MTVAVLAEAVRELILKARVAHERRDHTRRDMHFDAAEAMPDLLLKAARESAERERA